MRVGMCMLEHESINEWVGGWMGEVRYGGRSDLMHLIYLGCVSAQRVLALSIIRTRFSLLRRN